MLGLFDKKLYVRIHPEWLTIRDVSSGTQVREPPLVAISTGGKEEVLAIGNEASALKNRPNVKVVNPFAHPRTPLSDFTVADVLIKGFVRKVYGRRLFTPSPTMVLHLAMDLKGGITQIEGRALRELGLGAGAAKAIGWIGPDLTDEQVRQLEFPPSGQVVD